MKKVRKEIPNDLAAKVLFFSDRTCCVCRNRNKPVQIHHIDENPSNNVFKNLAVVCLDCHNDTMLKGGFGRKLNAEQVILYRDDWLSKVKESREIIGMTINQNQGGTDDEGFINYITSIVDIYIENKQYMLLASLYNSIGNYELRDKYIEKSISVNPSDSNICYLRAIQGKPELIPSEVISRETERYTKNRDYTERARFYIRIGKDYEAVRDYVKGINDMLESGKVFSAAFYLKELVKENLIEKLFEIALRQASEENDLWWQVRALEELGWKSELKYFLLQNAQSIESSGDDLLIVKLKEVMGSKEEVLEYRKKIAKSVTIHEVAAELEN